jgi:hypothetical protein
MRPEQPPKVNRVEDDPGERTTRVRNAPKTDANSGLSFLSRGGWQHGEEINVVVPPASQLGAVVKDAADFRADQGPAAEEIAAINSRDP